MRLPTKSSRKLIEDMSELRDRLEMHQVAIYLGAVIAATLFALTSLDTNRLEAAINPALAFMLFVTFLQVPLADLGRAFTRLRFLGALLTANFLVVPVLAALLLQLLPPDPMIRLGVLLVLLTPCIDYVVTFSHLGRADAKLLLASTPALLLSQMLLLPIYLKVLLGDVAADLVHLEPFVHAFVWLIAVPLVLAGSVQLWASRSTAGNRIASGLGLMPVPATAVVLFIVVAAVLPQLDAAQDAAVSAIPVYVVFAMAAPILGWGVARFFRLKAEGARAVAFSVATRNSLVVLPLALAVPNAIPVLPAIIVTQTLVELLSELVYVRLVPKFIRDTDAR